MRSAAARKVPTNRLRSGFERTGETKGRCWVSNLISTCICDPGDASGPFRADATRETCSPLNVPPQRATRRKLIKVPAQNSELNWSQLFPFLHSIRIVVKEKLYYKIL